MADILSFPTGAAASTPSWDDSDGTTLQVNLPGFRVTMSLTPFLRDATPSVRTPVQRRS